MVVQILVAQRQPVNALREHLRQLVLDEQRRTAVTETPRQTAEKVNSALHLAQQQGATVTGYLTRTERRFHPARKMRCKRERSLATLCHKKGRLRTATTTSRQRSYAMKRRPFQLFFRSPLKQSPVSV